MLGESLVTALALRSDNRRRLSDLALAVALLRAGLPAGLDIIEDYVFPLASEMLIR
jgi:hypothetical protein